MDPIHGTLNAICTHFPVNARPRLSAHAKALLTPCRMAVLT